MRNEEIEFIALQMALEKYVYQKNFRLKKIFNLRGERLDLFWQDIWDDLGDSEDKSVEQLEKLVEAKTKSLTQKGKK